MLRKFIPSTLIGRSIIIIFVPIIVLVLITALVFYQTSWNIISKRLAESVVADINVLVKLIDDNLEVYAKEIANDDFKMKINITDNAILDPLLMKVNRGILSKRLEQSLSNLDKPFIYDLSDLESGALIIIQLEEKLLVINVDKDRIYSETAFVFLLWMILLLRQIFFLLTQVAYPANHKQLIHILFAKDFNQRLVPA